MNRFTQDAYFYSNTCHVCRAYGNTVKLKRCAGCKTIAYCSKEHQSKHWSRHKELCKLLTQILQCTETTLGMKDKRDMSMESWTRARTNLMLLVQIKLGRKLEHYEMEMFKFPRACTVCHETNSQKLIDCAHCPAASFCSDHKLNDAHKIQCKLLKLCFEMDTVPMQFSLENLNIISQFKDDKIPKSMRDIVDLYVLPYVENSQAEFLAAWVSEYLTRPLTFLYALGQLQSPKLARMNVLVIGANAMETESLAYWETLLHCERSLAVLRLILVGPELQPRMYQVDLCKDCTAKNVKLHIQTINTLYSEYVDSNNFLEPHYVVGFNLGIHECEDVSSVHDTWARSLKQLSRLDCPFVMTSYTLQESQDEKKRLADLLGNRVKPFRSEKNPFSSLRPHRDFESELFFYQNNYVTIYEKLS